MYDYYTTVYDKNGQVSATPHYYNLADYIVDAQDILEKQVPSSHQHGVCLGWYMTKTWQCRRSRYFSQKFSKYFSCCIDTSKIEQDLKDP